MTLSLKQDGYFHLQHELFLIMLGSKAYEYNLTIAPKTQRSCLSRLWREKEEGKKKILFEKYI